MAEKSSTNALRQRLWGRRTTCLLAGLTLAAAALPCRACEVNTSALGAYGGSVSMIVRAGETCSYDVGLGITRASMGGFNHRSSYTITNVALAERPAHGRAGISGRSSVAYNAAAGFQGADAFRVRLTTEQAGPSNIDFAVQVRP